MPLSSVISSDPDAKKKKKVPGKRNFPQGKRNHVFSVLRTSLQAPTVPKREKKKKKKRQWCHHPPAWSNVLRGTHTALPAAKTSQKKGKKKDDIITCPGLWPQHCVSHLREPTLLFWTTPTASVTEKEAGRIGVTDGIEIRLSHNAYCEGTFVARGEIISKKSQAAGRGSTWQRKERTDFKEGFKLEPTDRKKKKIEWELVEKNKRWRTGSWEEGRCSTGETAHSLRCRGVILKLWTRKGQNLGYDPNYY